MQTEEDHYWQQVYNEFQEFQEFQQYKANSSSGNTDNLVANASVPGYTEEEYFPFDGEGAADWEDLGQS